MPPLDWVTTSCLRVGVLRLLASDGHKGAKGFPPQATSMQTWRRPPRTAMRDAFDPLGTAEPHSAPNDAQNRYFCNPPVHLNKLNLELDDAGKCDGRIF